MREDRATTGGVRRFKPYPAYKDSGVEWLGEIPAHWEVSRFTEAAALLNGYPFDAQFFVRGDGTPLVRIRDLAAAETEVNYVGPDICDAWIVPGDLIIGMDGDFNVARWRGSRALLNQRMCCLRPLPGRDAGFMAYLLPLPLKLINDLTYSTTVKHLSSRDVCKIRFGAPPFHEQHSIAVFLDRETAKIDTLLAKKERLIELLQEERTAFITRAVTKGLDPNIPMKESGVEWLGPIPAHWEMHELRRLSRRGTSITYGIVQAGPDVEGGVPYIRTSDMAGDALPKTGYQRTSPEIDASYHRSKVVTGDVVVAIRATVGKALAVPDHLEGANLTQGTAKISPGLMLDSQFLLFALQSSSSQQRFEALSKGATFREITLDMLRRLPIPVPPLQEQAAIVSALRPSKARIGTLIAKVHTAMDYLAELRSALISAAVTGKIDVRDQMDMLRG